MRQMAELQQFQRKVTDLSSRSMAQVILIADFFAEARSDKMRQMAELQQFQRKVIDLEFKVKTLETSLTEKNAMVRALSCPPVSTENLLSAPVYIIIF
jgi:hypothetical protein